MMYRWSVFAILVILGLSGNAALAVICFEGTPLQTFQGTYYRFSGEESEGEIYVKVRRADADVNSFEFESFQYVVSEVATPIFGGATAAAGVDFNPTPSGGSSGSFPENSTVTELCVDVILDDVACENPEDFRIRLISLNPAISTVCNTEAIVTIRDSTAITVGFTTSTTSVREDAPGVSLSVTRSSRIQNFNLATLSVVEDPDQGGCIAAPGRISYPCFAQRCADGTTFDLTQDVVRSVTLSLVPDDSEIDGNRECRILLRPQQGSMCIFNITRGSTQLRVMDNEVVFLRFDMNFYEEDEDEGGVNVTVEMIGFGFVPITASGPVDFNIRIVNGTGNSTTEVGVDLPDREYNSSVPPGQSSTSVRIFFNPDDIYELTETFELVLTPSTRRYNVFPALPFRANIQIANDDMLMVFFDRERYSVSEDAGVARITVLSTKLHTIRYTVIVTTADGSAAINEDYRGNRFQITFPVGNQSVTFDIPIVNDAECEGPEFFNLSIVIPQEAADIGVEPGIPIDAFVDITDDERTDIVIPLSITLILLGVMILSIAFIVYFILKYKRKKSTDPKMAKELVCDYTTGVVSGEREITGTKVEITPNPAYETVTSKSITPNMVDKRDCKMPNNEEGMNNYPSRDGDMPTGRVQITPNPAYGTEMVYTQ